MLNDMADILGELHKFVPKVRKEQEFYVDEQTEPACVQVDYFNHILIGGDQLTVARIRGCQRVLSNSSSGEERLEGLIPVVEDWHAKMCFMKV